MAVLGWWYRAVRVIVMVAMILGVAACGDESAERNPDESAAGSNSATAARGTRPDSLRAAVPGDSEKVTLEVGAPLRKYGVASAIVEYRNERLGRRQTLYFDHGGAEEAVYLESGDDSVGVPFDVSIYTGTWRFDYNRSERKGIAKQQPNERGPVLGLIPDPRTVSLTPLEPRTIAGRRASGIAFGAPQTRAWLWKGIPLRIERPIRGGADTLVLEAASIRVDEKIPPERFQVPEDVDISRLK
jgi:hypothetical protein